LVFDGYHHGLFFKFLTVYGATYLLNVAGLYFFNAAGVSNYLAGAILILPVAFIAFFLNKTFVFSSV